MSTNKAGSRGTINLNEEQRSFIHLTTNVHHLPCCIKFTGPTDVSHYFNPKPSGVEVDGLQVEEAYFRGRKLQGASVPVPDGYSGFILGKKNSSKNEPIKNTGRGKAPKNDDGSDNNWEMLAKCGNMTFWNHGSLPSQDDACLRLFHWFTVSKATGIYQLKMQNLELRLHYLGNTRGILHVHCKFHDFLPKHPLETFLLV